MNRAPNPHGSSRDAGLEPLPVVRSPVLEAVAVVMTWRRVILGFLGGVLLITLVYSLVAPPVYSARASILPKQEENQLTGLSHVVSSQLAGLAESMSGGGSSTDILMSIMESRYLRDRIIEKLDLIPILHIKAKTPQLAREAAEQWIEGHVEIGLTRRMGIFVNAKAGTPKLAADLANSYFEELDKLNQEFAFTSAKQTRLFIEQRMAETRDSLAASQDRLADFQREHGMVALDEQARAAVEVASKLQGELMSLQSQLDVQSRYFSASNSKTRDLQYRIAAIKGRLASLSGKDPTAEKDDGLDLVIPFASMPALGRRLAELMLDVKTQEAVYTLLITQYQQAKIDEARDVPTIQVLDRATEPAGRSAPRRRINMILGFAGGLLGGVLLAFGLEYVRRLFAGVHGAQIRRLVGPGAARVESWLARLHD